jgi:hypothetical protein
VSSSMSNTANAADSILFPSQKVESDSSITYAMDATTTLPQDAPTVSQQVDTILQQSLSTSSTEIPAPFSLGHGPACPSPAGSPSCLVDSDCPQRDNLVFACAKVKISGCKQCVVTNIHIAPNTSGSSGSNGKPQGNTESGGGNNRNAAGTIQGSSGICSGRCMWPTDCTTVRPDGTFAFGSCLADKNGGCNFCDFSQTRG